MREIQYPIGTLIRMYGKGSSEYHVGEVVGPDHESLENKLIIPGDVCVYWQELEMGTTYDAEFLDEHAQIIGTLDEE